MKSYSIYIKNLLAFFVGLLLVSCEDFLDVKPKGKDIATTYEHYDGLMNNTKMANLIMAGEGGGGGVTIMGDPDLHLVMSPEILISDEGFDNSNKLYQRSYTWSADIYDSDANSEQWGVFYSHNYVYCKIINEVMSASTGTAEGKKRLQAEARVNRAFLHFMVLNFFAKPYNPSTASSDQGIPIVVNPNAGDSGYTRETVQKCYDFIITELQEGIAELSKDVRSTHRFRIGACAAHSILARVYFYMKNYSEALKEAEKVIELISSTDFHIELYNYNDWGDPFTPMWPMDYAPPTQLDDSEVILARVILTFATTSGLFPSFFIDPDRYTLYEPEDIRRYLFSEYDIFGDPLPNNPDGYLARTSPSSITAATTLPELYLMIAECKARENDISGAKSMLEFFREHRMPAEYAAVPALAKDDLIRFIIDERAREMACTGDGWFTLRRLWDDPLFAGKSYTRTVNGQTYTLTAERLVMRIPYNVMQFNKGTMQDNP